MTCTCTPAQYSQCHKKCDRVAIDADYSGAEHITVPATDGINFIITGAVGSPLQSQLNADAATIKRLQANVESLKQMFEVSQRENEQLKQWKTEAMEVMAPIDKIGKAIGVKIGESIHDKILPAIERLTLQLGLAEMSNRKLRELATELKEAILKKIPTVNTGDPVEMRVYNAIHNLNNKLYP
jgi:hypothetical protein